MCKCATLVSISVASATDAYENCAPDTCTLFITLHTLLFPNFSTHISQHTVQESNLFIRSFFSILKRRYSLLIMDNEFFTVYTSALYFDIVFCKKN